MGIQERRQRERQLRRSQILDAARHLLIQKGISNTSVSDIAHDAEVSVGTVYLYFRNKEEILSAIHEEGMRLLRDRISGAIAAGEDAVTRLKNIGNAYRDFGADGKSHFDAFSYILAFPGVLFADESRLSLGEDGSQILDMVARVISDGTDRKIFRDVDARKYAILMWSTLHGILQLRKVSDLLSPDHDFDEFYRYNLDYLIESITR